DGSRLFTNTTNATDIADAVEDLDAPLWEGLQARSEDALDGLLGEELAAAVGEDPANPFSGRLPRPAASPGDARAPESRAPTAAEPQAGAVAAEPRPDAPSSAAPGARQTGHVRGGHARAGFDGGLDGNSSSDADGNGDAGPRTDDGAEIDEQAVDLPAPGAGQDLLADYASLGLSLGAHPMALLRERPEFRRCSRALDLRRLNHGRFVRIAGLVTGRQRPSTASGVLFLTLEDETGNSNVVIWTSVLARFRGPILGGRLLLVKGVMEREGPVIHVVAGHIADYSHHIGSLRSQSRDFH
ncbi:MAG TPA: OB-fold nucleic acid binding domain-containing protein, partial [Pseudomonadales bacterium]|nr:OB-fold nucleic acid binding domain-containing protein [Pseudomonadales bacterium]